jgi:hypothetical protein
VGAESEFRQSRADPLSYLLLRSPEKSKPANVPRFILIRINTERHSLALVTELKSFGNIFCTVEVASISDFSCLGNGTDCGAHRPRVDDPSSASKEEDLGFLSGLPPVTSRMSSLGRGYASMR